MDTTIDHSRPRPDSSLSPADAGDGRAQGPPAPGFTTPIVTIGPAGSDAETEAHKYATTVQLATSADDAMALAAAYRVYALVGGGYRSFASDATQLAESWNNDHTHHAGVLYLHRFWESPIAQMCFAVRRDLSRLAAPRTVAIPPSAQHFAGQYVVGARPVLTGSKPQAARMAAHGQVDACITSVAAAARYPALDSRFEWRPTMQWRLYGPASVAEG